MNNNQLRSVTARLVAAGAVVALAAPPASAGNGHHEGTGRDFSGCVHGITHYGAYVEVDSSLSVNWTSASHAHVDWANNESTVSDCGPSGRQTPGGQLSFHTRIEFQGDQIQSCSFGFPAGASCTVDPHHNQAIFDYSTPPADNTEGRGSIKVNGVDVNTGKTGHIYSVKYTTATTLTHGAESSTGQSTIDLHY